MATLRRPPVVGSQEDLRLPSSVWPGVELTCEQLTTARVEPAHTHLAPAYPVRHGWGGSHQRAARDGRDKTPHADTDPFSQAARRCCAESACCKHMFQVFHMFQKYVASVSYGCCKSGSGYCICYKCFYLDVLYVSHICYKCFI